MSLKIKLAPNSPIHLSAEDQKQLLRHQANECAKVANRFEQRAADDKGCPAALPRDMCRAISLSTEAMADYIARKADVWAVEQQATARPRDVAYSDASVEQRRQRIFRNFMELVGEEIAKRHPDAGSLRLEARRKVTQKIAQAIEMSLSKCDMVGVVGHSRLLARRLDVPTCAACDRPLINRRNPYRGPEPPDAPRDRTQSVPSLPGLRRAVGRDGPRPVPRRDAPGARRPPLRQAARLPARERCGGRVGRTSPHRPRTVVRGGSHALQGHSRRPKRPMSRRRGPARYRQGGSPPARPGCCRASRAASRTDAPATRSVSGGRGATAPRTLLPERRASGASGREPLHRARGLLTAGQCVRLRTANRETRVATSSKPRVAGTRPSLPRRAVRRRRAASLASRGSHGRVVLDQSMKIALPTRRRAAVRLGAVACVEINQ